MDQGLPVHHHVRAGQFDGVLHHLHGEDVQELIRDVSDQLLEDLFLFEERVQFGDQQLKLGEKVVRKQLLLVRDDAQVDQRLLGVRPLVLDDAVFDDVEGAELHVDRNQLLDEVGRVEILHRNALVLPDVLRRHLGRVVVQGLREDRRPIFVRENRGANLRDLVEDLQQLVSVPQEVLGLLGQSFFGKLLHVCVFLLNVEVLEVLRELRDFGLPPDFDQLVQVDEGLLQEVVQVAAEVADEVLHFLVALQLPQQVRVGLVFESDLQELVDVVPVLVFFVVVVALQDELDLVVEFEGAEEEVPEAVVFLEKVFDLRNDDVLFVRGELEEQVHELGPHVDVGVVELLRQEILQNEQVHLEVRGSVHLEVVLVELELESLEFGVVVVKVLGQQEVQLRSQHFLEEFLVEQVDFVQALSVFHEQAQQKKKDLDDFLFVLQSLDFEGVGLDLQLLLDRYQSPRIPSGPFDHGDEEFVHGFQEVEEELGRRSELARRTDLSDLGLDLRLDPEEGDVLVFELGLQVINLLEVDFVEKTLFLQNGLDELYQDVQVAH